MRDFKFLSPINDNDAIEPIEPYHSETPQIYTQIIRVELPINDMTEDHLNHLKISNENMLLNEISDTLDFRHEIISVDGNGFTLRSELFI
jgi:hypothetical protein